MTELYIDEQPVALPENFSFDLIKENPFFEKGGDFTLEICLDLEIPMNARLYKHLNRFNAGSSFKNRSARLIVDGRTVLNGTEIILEVSDSDASIHLVSGNSELNFLVGADRKLQDLDLGEIPEIQDIYMILGTWSQNYPESDFACPIIKAMNGDTPTYINSAVPYKLGYNAYGDLGYYQSITEYLEEINPDYFRAMPYLNYIIEKTILALGYTLKYNCIRDTVYNKLVIIHANNPKTYAELMPDMTVADFITNVERLLDVLFVIREDKQVEIIFRYDYYKEPVYFVPSIVSDQFERKYLNPDEEPLLHLSSNIRYDFDDTAYGKKADIDPEVRKRVIEHRGDNLREVYTTSSRYGNKLFVDEETGFEFLMNDKRDFYSVNLFRRVTHPEAENDIEISIIPVEMDIIRPLLYTNSSTSTYTGIMQIPVVNYFNGDDESVLSAQEIIEGAKETDHSMNKMQVAFMNGVFRVRKDGEPDWGEPTDPWSELLQRTYPNTTTHYNAPWIQSPEYLLLDDTYSTLAFYSEGKGLYESIYMKASDIDTSQEITLHGILDGVIPKPTDIFLVEGKECVCKSIQFKITPDGFYPEYEAILYPKN